MTRAPLQGCDVIGCESMVEAHVRRCGEHRRELGPHPEAGVPTTTAEQRARSARTKARRDQRRRRKKQATPPEQPKRADQPIDGKLGKCQGWPSEWECKAVVIGDGLCSRCRARRKADTERSDLDRVRDREAADRRRRERA